MGGLRLSGLSAVCSVDGQKIIVFGGGDNENSFFNDAHEIAIASFFC
jgi:hypothetical protein